jgi:hypothetical protein
LPIVTGAAGTVYRLSRIARALPALWGRSGAIVSRLVFGFPPFAQAAAKARRGLLDGLFTAMPSVEETGVDGTRSYSTWAVSM